MPIEDLGDWVKPYLKGLWEDQAARMQQELDQARKRQKSQPKERPRPEPVEQEATSTKNAVTDAERAARDLDPVMKEARVANPDTVAAAEQAMKDNPSLAQEIIDRLNNDPEPSISLMDEAVMFIHKVDLRIKMRQAAEKAANENLSDDSKEKARREYSDLLLEHELLDQATHRSGAVWGRFGQFRSRMMLEDYSFETQHTLAKAALGRPLTKAETNKLEKLASEVERLTEENTKLADELAEQQDRIDSETVMDELAKNFAGKRKKKKAATLKARGDELIREGRDSLESMFLGVSANPMLNPEAYLAIAKIGAGLILKGVSIPARWIESMRFELGDEIFSRVEDSMDELYEEARRLMKKEVVPHPSGTAPKNRYSLNRMNAIANAVKKNSS